MIAQPLGHDIGLTDMASVADGFFVVTQQEVNTDVLGLRAYKKIRGSERLADRTCPVQLVMSAIDSPPGVHR